MEVPSLSQDLGDLADVVLTKLRESDGANESPTVTIYAKRKRDPVPCSSTRLKRARVDGTELWCLWPTTAPVPTRHDTHPTELPAVKSARTAIRLALGRAYCACGTDCGTFEVKMVVQTGSMQALPFNELVDPEHSCRLSPTHEMEMTRILQEMELVRVVPVKLGTRVGT